MSNLLVGKFRQADNIDDHYEIIILSNMEIFIDWLIPIFGDVFVQIFCWRYSFWLIDNIEHILVILCFVVLAVGLSDILPFSNFLASFLSLVEELYQLLVVMLVMMEEVLTSLPETLISKLDGVEQLYMFCPQWWSYALLPKLKNWQAYGQIDQRKDRKREVDRQRSRQTSRQADRQEDRQTER